MVAPLAESNYGRPPLRFRLAPKLIAKQFIEDDASGSPRRPVVLNFGKRRCEMRYIVAWLLGVPFGLIVLWYVVGHVACG